MASELARRIVDAIADAKLNDPDGVTDELLAPVREALSNTNRCIAHELYPATIDKVRLALASLDPNPEDDDG